MANDGPDFDRMTSFIGAVRERIGTVVVGQDVVVERLLISLFTGGHILLQGVPGVAKTLLASVLSKTLDLEFARVQFTIDLLPSDAQIVREHIEVLQELGFGVSEFGGDTFLVDALPVYVQDGPAESLLVEIVRELEKAGKKRGARELVREKIAQAACQTAVRTKDQLSDAEIEKLVADLAKTEMPYTSPRGRPTLIYTSFTELNRKFSRN